MRVIEQTRKGKKNEKNNRDPSSGHAVDKLIVLIPWSPHNVVHWHRFFPSLMLFLSFY